jgi:excisionase family DNA binding protein
MTHRPIGKDELDLLPMNRACRLIGISASTLYRYEAQGLITSVRTPGGQRRYQREDLIALLNGGGQAAEKIGQHPVSSAPDLETGEPDTQTRLDGPGASPDQRAS